MSQTEVSAEVKVLVWGRLQMPPPDQQTGWMYMDVLDGDVDFYNIYMYTCLTCNTHCIIILLIYRSLGLYSDIECAIQRPTLEY